MNFKLKQSKLFVVGIIALIVVAGFLYVSQPLEIVGENTIIRYEGTYVNGQVRMCQDDAMEMEWRITNVPDIGEITNWTVWVEVKEPNNGTIHETTYYGTSSIPVDMNVVFSTVWMGKTFDTIGEWELSAVILEGTTDADTDYIIDYIGNETISVVNCSQLDDGDMDGIYDIDDNCPNEPNPDQLDTDNDGIGDVCDSTPDGEDVNNTENDADNDGILDSVDNCPSKANPSQLDSDGDGIGNSCDSTPYGSTSEEGIDIVGLLTANWMYVIVGIIVLAVVIVVGKRFL